MSSVTRPKILRGQLSQSAAGLPIRKGQLNASNQNLNVTPTKLASGRGVAATGTHNPKSGIVKQTSTYAGHGKGKKRSEA